MYCIVSYFVCVPLFVLIYNLIINKSLAPLVECTITNLVDVDGVKNEIFLCRCGF